MPRKKANPNVVEAPDEPVEVEVEEEPVVEEPAQPDTFGHWTRDASGGKPFKVFLYGPSGAGKTTMASTFPNPLFLDLEDGMRSIRSDQLEHEVLRYPGDPKENITSMAEVKKFYAEVKAIEHNAPFDTIVIDSMNELQNLIMKNILFKFDSNRQMDDQPTLQDYGKLARDSLTIVRLFLQLPFNIIFTCAAVPQEYIDQQVYPVFLGRKTGPEILRLVEMVGYCHTRTDAEGEVLHMVSFETTPDWVAKDRYGIEETVIPNNYSALKGA